MIMQIFRSNFIRGLTARRTSEWSRTREHSSHDKGQRNRDHEPLRERNQSDLYNALLLPFSGPIGAVFSHIPLEK